MLGARLTLLTASPSASRVRDGDGVNKVGAGAAAAAAGGGGGKEGGGRGAVFTCEFRGGFADHAIRATSTQAAAAY